MPVYDVALRQGSRMISTPIVAGSVGEARLIGQRSGLVMGEPKVRKEGRAGGMTPGERYVFLYQLATMSIAKVPLSRALEIMRESHGGRIGKAASQLQAGVSTGRQIADLMYEDKKNFPGAVGLLVKAGSKGAGGTAASLKKAAEFERQILGAATKGAKGLYAAGFWVVTATVSIFACPLWLTPYLKDSQLFKLTESPVDWGWLDMLSYATGAATLVLMLLGIFLFFLVGVGQRIFPQFSDAIVMKLPYLKDLVFTRDNFVSLYRFSLMVKAGVSLEEALDTTYSDTRKGALKEDLSRALMNVKTGRPWAEDFRTVHPTDKASLSMATDKERLGEILEQVADQNKSIYIRRLEVLQPIMATIGGLSMILVYAITGLYSIVPFSELFGKLMSDGQGF
jgi:general secretion pathway protein F